MQAAGGLPLPLQMALHSIQAATCTVSATIPTKTKFSAGHLALGPCCVIPTHTVAVAQVSVEGSAFGLRLQPQTGHESICPMSVPRPSVTSAGSQEDERPLRSKGLLPAIGVGAAVYIVTGWITLPTLGLVGIGAGVGYGVGSWIADKMQKKEGQTKVPLDQLPWAVQVALQQWQDDRLDG
eukprot:Skav211007  [mRNA]  locus=scaffold1610:331948:340469:+ [translate_table: standard]